MANDFLKEMFINEAKPALERHSGSGCGITLETIDIMNNNGISIDAGTLVDLDFGLYLVSVDGYGSGMTLVSINKTIFPQGAYSKSHISTISYKSSPVDDLTTIMFRTDYNVENGSIYNYDNNPSLKVYKLMSYNYQ